MNFFSRTIHVGININDRSIELVVIDDSENIKALRSASRVELIPGTIERGRIISEVQLKRALLSLVSQAGLQSKERYAATLSVSEDLVFPFTVPHDATLKQEQRIQKIREEAERKLPVDTNALSFFIVHPKLDHIDVVYAMDANILGAYTKILKSCGLLIEYIEPESVALSRYVLPDVQKHQIITLLDIGAQATRFITLQDGVVLLSQSIPFGTDSLEPAAKNVETLSQTGKNFADECAKEFSETLSFLREQNLSDTPYVIALGGGSLFAHFILSLSKRLSTEIHFAASGQPMNSASLTAEQQRVYAHSIGSALRTSSSIGGNRLEGIQVHNRAMYEFISIDAFKQRIRLIIVTLAVLFLILIAGILIAVFKHQPPSIKNYNAQESVNAGAEAATFLDSFSVQFSTANDPLHITLLKKTMTKDLSIETTGTTSVDKKAKGTVTIYNNSTVDKPLANGSRFQSTSGVLFRSQEQLTIPAHGSLDATLIADNPGVSGNIPAGKFTLPGLNSQNQLLIYAVSTKPFTGGVESQRIVSSDDVTIAERTLKDIVTSNAQSQFPATNASTYTVFLKDNSVYSTKSTPAVGSVSDTVSVTVTGDSFALAMPSDSIESLVHERLGSNMQIVSITLKATQFDAVKQQGTLSAAVQWKKSN